MPQGAFNRKIRSKLSPGNTEGGDSDVGEDDLAVGLGGGRLTEDYSVSVQSTVRPEPLPAKGLG